MASAGVGWSTVAVFIALRLIAGDWKRIKNPDAWDFIYAQGMTIDLLASMAMSLLVASVVDLGHAFAWLAL
jgi:hypothetical protein